MKSAALPAMEPGRVDALLDVAARLLRTLPISRVMARAISSLRRVRISPTFRISSPRFGAGVRLQPSYAFFAAATAASTSLASLAGNSPTTSSRLAGFRSGNSFPLFADTHFPPMKFLKVVMGRN